MANSAESHGLLKGCRFTLSGLLTILFLLSVSAAVIAMIMTSLHATREEHRRVSSRSNLSQMYKAMHVYAGMYSYGGEYMPHTGDAFFTCLLGHAAPEHHPAYPTQAPCIGNRGLFYCPGSGPASVTPGGTMADYMGPRRHPRVPPGNPSALVDWIDPGHPIACERPGLFSGGGNVLRWEGSVAFLTDDDYTEAVSKCAD